MISKGKKVFRSIYGRSLSFCKWRWARIKEPAGRTWPAGHSLSMSALDNVSSTGAISAFKGAIVTIVEIGRRFCLLGVISELPTTYAMIFRRSSAYAFHLIFVKNELFGREDLFFALHPSEDLFFALDLTLVEKMAEWYGALVS